MELFVNEWMELTTPERVRNVPKSDEREGKDDEQHVPDLQHPALLLDHHRVQERGRREPRHERGVLDRIPRVVPAPADLDVRPVTPEELADAERGPREQRPAAGGDEPTLVEPAREQRAHRECERHREPDVPEVEERRMGEHVRVLQARRHSGAIKRRRLRRKRARDEHDKEREERRDDREHGHDPHDEVARPRAIQADRGRAEPREDQQPEKQRPLLPSPERRDRVRRRQRLARRARDVLEREVVPQREPRGERRRPRPSSRTRRRGRSARSAPGGVSRGERHTRLR